MTKITRMGIAAILIAALMFAGLPGPHSAQADATNVQITNLTCSSATITATVTRLTDSPNYEDSYVQVAAGAVGNPAIAGPVDTQELPAGDAGSAHEMTYNVTFPAQPGGTLIVFSVWQWVGPVPGSTLGPFPAGYVTQTCPDDPGPGDGGETPTPPPPGDGGETPTPPSGPGPAPAVMAATPTPPPLPGPDMVYMPSWSVMGRFVEDTELLYAPDLLAGTGKFIEAGKSLWVLGLDESGEFRQVVFSGGYYWVPVDSMAPIDEAPWYGRGLPGEIVDYTS